MKTATKQFATEWFAQYDLASKQEGWLLTNDQDGKIVIAKVDDPIAWIDDGWPLEYTEPIFPYDEDALEFVQRAAENGSIMHIGALRIHESRLDAN